MTDEHGASFGNPKRKTAALARFFTVSVAVYLTFLFSLQILRGGEFRNRATQVAKQTSVIPAQRGEIYDRDYAVPLVINSDSFAVAVIPAAIPAARRDDVFRRLALSLDVPFEEIQRKVPPSYYHLYQQIEVKTSVSYETIAMIAENLDDFPGVTWNDKPVRNYLDVESLVHVIGYVGDINREELQILYNKGYKTGDIIGKTGIEKTYDSLLRGKEGRKLRTVDVKGRNVSMDAETVEPPEMGTSIVLTIDRRIQELSEKALGERMGSIVVLKPNSGEILAMVSYPWYNPNIFQTQGSGNEYMSLLKNPNKPLINRAVQSSYPPASIFKIPMSAAILEENSFPPEKTVDCDGEISYGQRVWRCWIRRPGHGPLNLQQALAQSCDVYFWQVCRDNLGIERMVDYAKEFGLGETSGVDLPGENPGFVPTPQWKERRLHEKWMHGDTMNMSIGQGFLLVSPLQMANMIAMVVNDGTIYKPHILKETRDPSSGALISSIEPEILIDSRIKDEVFNTVKKNMRSVNTEGTARYAISTKTIPVAGKTGTGEVGLDDRWHCWYAAFGPYEAKDPDDVVVVVVSVEASNKWDWWAPYATNIVYQGIFANQEYEEALKTLGWTHLNTTQARRE